MPSPPVTWTKKAKADIQEITEFYVSSSDRQTAVRTIATIVSKTNYLADNPMIGNRIEGLDERYQFWYAVDNKFRIYFKRLSKTRIKVLRVRSSKSRLLKITELE